MNHFYQTIGENWFTYPNLYTNAVLNANDGAHFVEIGSWKGRSAVFMAVEIINSGKKIKFDCIDRWGNYDNYLQSIECSISAETKIGVQNVDWLYNQFLQNIEPVKYIINPLRMTSMD